VNFQTFVHSIRLGGTIRASGLDIVSC
jgi:hypothetical protein